MSALKIRTERPNDEAPIHALTEAAFRDMPFSEGDEQHLIKRLRQAGDLELSLVAEQAGRIVGHVAFSPVTISDYAPNWYGLGPVSVWPELQRQGIGSALIERGLAILRVRRARGVVVLGDPAYYGRFGFQHDPDLRYPGPPPEYFQRLVLNGLPPKGIVRFAQAFG